MPFGGNPVANIETFHLNAALDDFAIELVPDSQWHRNGFTRPVVPLIYMNVGAAYRRAFDPDQDIIVSDRRFVDIFEPDAAFRLGFDQCTHVDDP
jgi:hypothetical protein